MSNVIDLVKEILLFLLGILFFLGAGKLVFWALLPTETKKRLYQLPSAARVPLYISCGFAINYLLALLIQKILISSIVVGVLSLLGFILPIVCERRSFPKGKLNRQELLSWLAVIFMLGLFFGPVVSLPLSDWDARSIWFFHAKMIYTAGSIGLDAGWLHPSAGFSHVDYPKLIPLMGAQAALTAGFWNEYLPKISILFVLTPIVLWLVSFYRRSVSYFFLAAFVLLGFYPYIWDGYMDGLLAVYVTFSVILLVRYMNSGEIADLISAVTCLAISMYIKNEGILFALVIVFMFLLATLIKKTREKRKFSMISWNYCVYALILLLPVITWSILKQKWNLSNDLQLGSAESLQMLGGRITSGAYRQILKAMFKQINVQVIIFLLLFSVSVSLKKEITKSTVWPLLVAAICLAGFTLIYLMTPHDLTWHLTTSIDRTMMPVNGCIAAASYFLLSGWENNKNTPTNDPNLSIND